MVITTEEKIWNNPSRENTTQKFLQQFHTVHNGRDLIYNEQSFIIALAIFFCKAVSDHVHLQDICNVLI